MKAIKRLFRNTYSGEDVYSSAIYQDGSWVYDKEFVAKSVNFQGFGQIAVVIGNGTSRLEFNLNDLKKPHLKKKLQTYGCNNLYNQFTPDFLVCTRSKVVQDIANSDYCSKNIAYANGSIIVDYPGSFHYVPQDPNWNSGSIAAYLACFNGHFKVYLLGFDGIDTPGFTNNVYADMYGKDLANTDAFMSKTMTKVFNTYPLVDFILVNNSGRGYMPADWYKVKNLRRISFRDLVLECDI